MASETVYRCYDVNEGECWEQMRVLPERVCVMKESSLEKKLQELVAEFGACNDPKFNKLAQLAKQAQDSHNKLKQSVDSLQESLDYLRICIKYQIFDLEATRRENKYLRKLLDESGKS